MYFDMWVYFQFYSINSLSPFIDYSNLESDLDSEFYTATMMIESVTQKKDPDTDSDVQVDEAILTKNIKLKNMKIKEIAGGFRLAGNKAGKITA